jgi:hypothetical protein
VKKQHIAVEKVVDESKMALGFIAYDSRARILSGTEILRLPASGQTNFRDAFKKIEEYIVSRTQSGDSVNVVFMTDGQDNKGLNDQDLSRLSTFLQESERRVVVHTLAFGRWNDFDAELLHKLTEMSNERDASGKVLGQFMNAKFHSHLEQYFAALLEFAQTHLFVDVMLNGIQRKVLGQKIGDRCVIDSLMPKTESDKDVDGASSCNFAVAGEDDTIVECQATAIAQDIIFDLKVLLEQEIETLQQLDEADRKLNALMEQNEELEEDAKKLLDQVKTRFEFFRSNLKGKRSLKYFQKSGGNRFISLMVKEKKEVEQCLMVRNWARNWPLQKIVDHNVNAINGIADDSVEGFERLGIRNVKELAEWNLFIMAKDFRVAVDKGKILMSAVLKDVDMQLVHSVKKMHDGRLVNNMIVKDFLELPVTVLRGVDNKSADFLQSIGNPITSIRKLGEWKFALWAQCILTTAAISPLQSISSVVLQQTPAAEIPVLPDDAPPCAKVKRAVKKRPATRNSSPAVPAKRVKRTMKK